MDGIPRSIWDDFPHPDGPSGEGHQDVPFSDFEVTLARQILSTDIARQQYILLPPVHPDVFLPVVASADDDERVVRELPRRAREHAVFTEYESDEHDSSDSDLSEEDACELENPSLFSHRATVEDLITSFHRNTIGPLTAPAALLPDDTLETALDRWDAEQAEHSLEMRWRATKRVAENWLTRVRPLRERQRARERERERARKRDGERGGMGRLVTTARDGTVAGGWPAAHPLVQHMQRRVPVQPKPAMVPYPVNAPPLALPPTAAPPAVNAPGLAQLVPAPALVPPPVPPPTSVQPSASGPAQNHTESPNGTDVLTTTSAVSTEQTESSSANKALVQHPQESLALQEQPAHTVHPPIHTMHPPSAANPPQPHAQLPPPNLYHPVHPPNAPSQPYHLPIHTPYDPRAPFFKEIPLEELVNIPPPADCFADGYAAGFADGVRCQAQIANTPPQQQRRGPLPYAAAHPRAALQNGGPGGYAVGRGQSVGYPYPYPPQGYPHPLPQPYPQPNGHAIPHTQNLNGNVNPPAQFSNIHPPLVHSRPPQPYADPSNALTPNLHVHPFNPQLPNLNPHANLPPSHYPHTQTYPAPQMQAPQAQPRPALQPPNLLPAPPHPNTEPHLQPNPQPPPHLSQPPHGQPRPALHYSNTQPNLQLQPRPHPAPPYPHPHPQQYPHPYPHPSGPSERDKIIRHLTLLAEAPRITAGQVLVRRPGMDGMVELFLALFPEQRARGDWGKPAVGPGTGLAEAKVEEVEEDEVKEAVKEEQEVKSKVDASVDAVPAESAQSTPPALETEALPVPPAHDTSATASPLTLYTDSPRGRKHWFEPDAQALAQLRNIVNFMETKGGWKRPGPKVRLVNGHTTPRGPDDLIA